MNSTGWWELGWRYRVSRLLSGPLIRRVPLFLLFGFNKRTLQEKGKRVLLRNLGFSIYGLSVLGLKVGSVDFPLVLLDLS